MVFASLFEKAQQELQQQQQQQDAMTTSSKKKRSKKKKKDVKAPPVVEPITATSSSMTTTASMPSNTNDRDHDNNDDCREAVKSSQEIRDHGNSKKRRHRRRDDIDEKLAGSDHDDEKEAAEAEMQRKRRRGSGQQRQNRPVENSRNTNNNNNHTNNHRTKRGEQKQEEEEEEDDNSCDDESENFDVLSPKHRISHQHQQEQSRYQHPHNQHVRANKVRAPVSFEAMGLSYTLQECCRNKLLQNALDLYWNRDCSNSQVHKYDNKFQSVQRDEFHACVTIDCCSRCGAMDEAEKIVQHLMQQNSHIAGWSPNVETRTALIKGYVHAGGCHNLNKAMQLFRIMMQPPPQQQQHAKQDHPNAAATAALLTPRAYQLPNVRTLNTLLRGCLWTAASRCTHDDDSTSNASSSNDPSNVILAGGVVTSEEAWDLYQEMIVQPGNNSQASNTNAENNNKTVRTKKQRKRDRRKLKEGADHYHTKQILHGRSVLDPSCFEYSITLLCKALRCDEAEQRIQQFMTLYNVKSKGKTSFTIPTPADPKLALSPADCQGVTETLAVVHLSLARAFALQGDAKRTWDACQRVLNAIRLSLSYLDANSDSTVNASDAAAAAAGTAALPPDRAKRGAQGGKRGWKQQQYGEVVGKDSPFHDNCRESKRDASNEAYRRHRLSELEAEAKELLKVRAKQQDAWSHKEFGKRLIRQLIYLSGGGTTTMEVGHEAPLVGKKGKTDDPEGRKRSFDPMLQTLTSSWLSFGLSCLADLEQKVSAVTIDTKNVASVFGTCPTGLFQKDGLIDFDQVFPSMTERPIDMELGSGFGDWIVRCARNHPARNYVAVELRADRAHQIFTKVILDGSTPLDNVCVVGAECGSFLRDRVPKGSLSGIFVNHPEPPTQTYGDDGTELQKIMDLGAEPGHMLNSATIVSAAHCLAPKSKIVIVTDNQYYARLVCATLVKVYRQHNGLLRPPYPELVKCAKLRPIQFFSNGVVLYEGQPSEVLGYPPDASASSGTSYFDRLWRTGAGSHAERKTRYLIIACR